MVKCVNNKEYGSNLVMDDKRGCQIFYTIEKQNVIVKLSIEDKRRLILSKGMREF